MAFSLGFVGFLTPALWMLTSSQHVMPAGPATQEDAVKSEEADTTDCAFTLQFK